MSSHPPLPVPPTGVEALSAAATAYAALAERAAKAAADLTRARTRTLWHGNAARAADDPQFRRALGESAGRAAIAAAAAAALRGDVAREAASVDEAARAVVGTAALARDVVRGLFDALGASATLEEHGLHLLRRELHDLDIAVRPADLAAAVGACHTAQHGSEADVLDG